MELIGVMVCKSVREAVLDIDEINRVWDENIKLKAQMKVKEEFKTRITPFRTCIHKMLMMAVPDFVDDTVYQRIGNSNTKRYHEFDCSAIKMMDGEHVVHDFGPEYEPCGWCHHAPKAGEIKEFESLDNFQSKSSSVKIPTAAKVVEIPDPEDIEICRDPYVQRVFKNSKCF